MQQKKMAHIRGSVASHRFPPPPQERLPDQKFYLIMLSRFCTPPYNNYGGIKLFSVSFGARNCAVLQSGICGGSRWRILELTLTYTEHNKPQHNTTRQNKTQELMRPFRPLEYYNHFSTPSSCSATTFATHQQ